MASNIKLDEYRTGYISTRHHVSDNCARALQLFEIGYTQRAAARILGLNEGTVKRYAKELQANIGWDVVATISPMKPRYDVWGPRPITHVGESTYSDGVSHAERLNERDRVMAIMHMLPSAERESA